MSEQWKLIDGFADYEVSNHGQVRRIRGHRGAHHMKPILKYNGMNYLQVRLSMLPKRALVTVHRLVALAFVPNPENKPCVNHIDCNSQNNHFSNLEWCTQSENIKHSRRLGRYDNRYKLAPPKPRTN